jgi:hypothetical protein
VRPANSNAPVERRERLGGLLNSTTGPPRESAVHFWHTTTTTSTHSDERVRELLER